MTHVTVGTMATAQFEEMMNYPFETSEHLVDIETHLDCKSKSSYQNLQFASAGFCMWFPAAAAPVQQVSAGPLSVFLSSDGCCCC